MKQLDTVVIGGGLNGLNCANKLARIGKNVLLLDAKKSLNGLRLAKKTKLNSLVSNFHSLGGEIVLDVTVKAVKLTRELKWEVVNEWSNIEVPEVVLATSLNSTKKLLQKLPEVNVANFWEKLFKKQPNYYGSYKTPLQGLFIAEQV